MAYNAYLDNEAYRDMVNDVMNDEAYEWMKREAILKSRYIIPRMRQQARALERVFNIRHLPAKVGQEAHEAYEKLADEALKREMVVVRDAPFDPKVGFGKVIVERGEYAYRRPRKR